MSNWLQKTSQELPFVSTRHGDIEFETGKPVTFPFMKNTEPAPYFGEKYQQHIEPHGRYMVLDELPEDQPQGTWQKGTVTFQNPLVIRFTGDPDVFYGDSSWKAELSRAFDGKTGLELSKAIHAAGFDGIITVWVQGDEPAHVKEIVDLTNLR